MKEDKYKWHSWFAWRPVYVGEWPHDKIVWLRTIQRRYEGSWGGGYWNYRK